MSYSSGFSWGTRNLNKDIKEEADSLSTSGSRLKSAKGIGASIGGLLGAAVLTAVTGGAAAPLLLAAAGGAGALAGSAIGGATSGVKESDLYKGNYLRNTRGHVATDIAKDEFGNVLKSAGKAFMGGMDPTSGLSKFGKGFGEGAGIGVEGIPGLQGGHALVGGKDMGAFMGGMQGGLGALFSTGAAEGASEAATNVAETAVSDVPLLGPLSNAPAYSGGGSSLVESIPTVASSSASPSTNLLDMATQGMGPVLSPGGGASIFEAFPPPQIGGGILEELFPGMNIEEAASSMGMGGDEFATWLEQMGHN